MAGYERLFLKENPFGERTREQRAALAFVNCAPFLEHLKNASPTSRKAVQFMGEKGRGKSTRLLAMSQRPGAFFFRASRDDIETVPARVDLLLLDELHLAPFLRKRALYKRTNALVVSTHRNLYASLKRANFDVLCVRVENTSPQDVYEIFRRRIEDVRLDKRAPSFDVAHAQRLVARFGDDIRAMESHLYECVQNANAPEDCFAAL